MIEIARLHAPVTALGPGRRLGIWLQGCTIGCAGCVARDTWTADPTRRVAVADVIAWCDAHDQDAYNGVTISGGEPSEQPAALGALVTALAARRARHGWDLLCYTGVEATAFAERCPEANAGLDGLVTGPFRAGEPTRLVWRGSANQQLIPLTPLGADRYGPYLTVRTDRPHLQVQVDDQEIRMIGIPRRGDLSRLTRALAAVGVHLKDVSWRP